MSEKLVEREISNEDEKQSKKRQAAQALFGLLSPDVDLNQAREERLS